MSKILIVGAGYAGMMAATRLEKARLPFTLINKHPYHYFTTLLHEAAGGRAAPRNYTVAIKNVLQQDTSVLSVDEVEAIHLEQKSVRGKLQTYPYDYLVIALGNAPEYFGIPGLREHSFVLRSLDTAVQIHSHIEDEFAAYANDQNPVHLRIVVGGAGLTGIELVGELLDWLPQLCMKHRIERENVQVYNIEAMSTVLPQLPKALQEVAVRVLSEKGATLRTGTKIVKVEAGVVHLDGGENLEAGTIIWTGGVRANPLLTEAGFTVDRRGRAHVNEFLQSVDDASVFIGGDAAWCDGEDGKPLPPTAQIATQMGPVIADNLEALMAGTQMQSFHAIWRGTLASLGKEIGVGQMKGLPVQGFVAGLAKEATKVKYLWDLGGIRLAAKKSASLVHL